MQDSIRISTLNDFVFCPKSIYFHDLYQQYDQEVYQTTVQTEGLAAHEHIDQQTYSTSRYILQWLPVYSQTYQLIWKIDLFNTRKKLLTERKKQIKRVYRWYKLQVYAQYFCLTEMGYQVEQLQLYSLDDNKVYPVPLPDESVILAFEQFLQRYRRFDPQDPHFSQNPKKCVQCIYRELCDYYKW